MSDRLIAARRLVEELVRTEQIEARRTSVLAADLAAFIDSLSRPPTGNELEDWLGEHRQVDELYASASALEALGERYFRPPAPEASRELHEPALERQLRDTLDAAPYLVYADWLQERGDLFGELIALGVAATRDGGDAQKRFDQYLERHDKLFLKDIRKTIGSIVRFDWHNGFISHIDESISELGAGRWARLLELRVASLVRSITLRSSCGPELDELIASRDLPLRELHVAFGHVPERLLRGAALRTFGAHHESITLAPGMIPDTLERLELQAKEITRDPTLAALQVRELVIKRSYWRHDRSPVVGLTGLALPQLAHLDIALQGDVAEVCGVLDSFAMPALASLSIHGARVRATDIERLVHLGVAPQLTKLALVNLGLADDCIPALRALALGELDVSDNELSPSGIATLQGVATRVVVGKQHSRGSHALGAIRAFAGGRFSTGEDLSDPSRWRDAGVAREGLRWARYQGSEPYELFVTADLERYGCSCPSRYQPCKHVIALAIVAERAPLPEAPSGGIERRVGYFRFMEVGE